ncbi:MAG: trypsin-like peptidase domain-containing protein [Gemmatimonadetes bacterium]|nr:trypsin-like peptidase domain-containing protein [Gemmatimonadota bacterium]
MKPELRIVSGSTAGTILVFSQSHITIGRHPESDIAFDPHDDIEVSVRHAAILVGPLGNLRARQIGVRFADSKQTFRARVTAVAEGEDADLAIIKVELRGEVPAIQGFNQRPDTVAVGAPVVVIGFPGGTDSPQLVRADGTYATPSLTAGTVSKNLPALIQINGYGTQGTSGSPIFDANGQVIGIINAGEVGSGGRIVYAVPASLAMELLASTNR